MTEPRKVRDALRRLGEPGASQRSVAAATGLSPTTIARIASGECDGIDGRLPKAPTPAEIRRRAREVRRAGGGVLVNPEIASKRDLAENTAANNAYLLEHAVEAPVVAMGDLLAGLSESWWNGPDSHRKA